MLAKLSAFSWMMIAVLAPSEQILGGERVGRRHQLRRAVLANLQRRQVAAGRMAAVPATWKCPPAELKSPGAPPVGATELASHLPTEWMCRPWKPGVSSPGRGGLHRDGGEVTRERDVGRGDRGAVGQFQVGGERLAAGLALVPTAVAPCSSGDAEVTASRSRPTAWCRAWCDGFVRGRRTRSTRERELRTRRRQRRS